MRKVAPQHKAGEKWDFLRLRKVIKQQPVGVSFWFVLCALKNSVRSFSSIHSPLMMSRVLVNAGGRVLQCG